MEQNKELRVPPVPACLLIVRSFFLLLEVPHVQSSQGILSSARLSCNCIRPALSALLRGSPLTQEVLKGSRKFIVLVAAGAPCEGLLGDLSRGSQPDSPNGRVAVGFPPGLGELEPS